MWRLFVAWKRLAARPSFAWWRRPARRAASWLRAAGRARCTRSSITSCKRQSSWPGPCLPSPTPRASFAEGSSASRRTRSGTCTSTRGTSLASASPSGSSRYATGSGSACRDVPTRPRSSPPWASVSRARTWNTRPHSPRGFARPGTRRGARLQELVGSEEIAHVRFGANWFRAFHSTLDFETWRRALVPPLSPMLMRGRPLQREARLRAGQTEQFLDELEAWQPAATIRLGPEPRRRRRAGGDCLGRRAARAAYSPKRGVRQAMRAFVPRPRGGAARPGARPARGRGFAARHGARQGGPSLLPHAAGAASAPSRRRRARASPRVRRAGARECARVRLLAGHDSARRTFAADEVEARARLDTLPPPELSACMAHQAQLRHGGPRPARRRPLRSTEADMAFVRAGLAEGGVQIEPDVAIVDELAIHGVLAPDGALTLGPVVKQRCDARGAWVSSERMLLRAGPVRAPSRSRARRRCAHGGGLLRAVRRGRLHLSLASRRSGRAAAAERDQRPLHDGFHGDVGAAARALKPRTSDPDSDRHDDSPVAVLTPPETTRLRAARSD